MDFPWNDLRTIQRFLGDPMETPDLCWTGHGAVGGSGSLRFPRQAQQQAGRSQGSGLGEASWSLRYMFFKVLNVVRTTWFSDEKSNMINMFQWFGWFWNLDHSGSGFGLTASPRSTAWGKWWRLVPAWDGSPCFGIAEMATCDSTGNRMFSISFFGYLIVRQTHISEIAQPATTLDVGRVSWWGRESSRPSGLVH